MEQYGLVTENKGDTALVNLQRHLVCEKCGRCGLLSGAAKRDLIIEALNPIKAEKGQRVLLESDDNQIILLSFMLYMVPILALVAGIALWLTQIVPYLGLEGRQELPAAAAGFILMGLVYYFIRIWDKRVKNNPRYKPVITSLIDDLEDDCKE
ncbi:MAG: SoxR reducing system RseC family protein [Dethiobacteria bacterium]|nr:SoxR reducing system RseC family protein [Bacillota bacterium]